MKNLERFEHLLNVYESLIKSRHEGSDVLLITNSKVEALKDDSKKHQLMQELKKDMVQLYNTANGVVKNTSLLAIGTKVEYKGRTGIIKSMKIDQSGNKTVYVVFDLGTFNESEYYKAMAEKVTELDYLIYKIS